MMWKNIAPRKPFKATHQSTRLISNTVVLVVLVVLVVVVHTYKHKTHIHTLTHHKVIQQFVLPDIGITFVFNLCNYAISSSRESRVFHFFATMPFLHFAKAGFSIFATIPFLHLAKQVFHLRNYAISSFREIISSSKTALIVLFETPPMKRPKTSKRRNPYL